MSDTPDDEKQPDLPAQEGGEILEQLRRLEQTLRPKPKAGADGNDEEAATGDTTPSVRASRDTVEARLRKRSGSG
jgi:hypothetical protein